jgi:putative transposase
MAIDIRTRMRFLAYGQQKSFSNGWAFMVLLVLWIRSFGIKHHLILQTDWGEEFGGSSGKKIAWMNHLLSHFDAELTRIQKARAEQNAYVERSHRTDDDDFYIPYGIEIKDARTLFLMAYSWIRYYNTKRDHSSIDNKSPLEYIKEIMPQISSNIALFPPVILDNISCHPQWKGGKDVCEHYISLFFFVFFYLRRKIG